MDPINPLVTVLAGALAFVAGMFIATFANSCW